MTGPYIRTEIAKFLCESHVKVDNEYSFTTDGDIKNRLSTSVVLHVNAVSYASSVVSDSVHCQALRGSPPLTFVGLTPIGLGSYLDQITLKIQIEWY